MWIGIGRIQNETSPLHRLPCDLLQEIFHHTCSSEQRKASRSAVTLSHVCTQWRVILLSTPQFWCNVMVDGREPSFVATCLARSGDLPLDVTVQFNYAATPYEYENDPGPESKFRVLENEDVRWRLDECREGLTLLVVQRDRIHRLYVNYIILGSDWIEGSVPEHEFFSYGLKNLRELWWYYDDEREIWSLPSRFFGGSLESLRHLRLENVDMSMGWIQSLTSLECIATGDSTHHTFMPDGMPEFFRRNGSLQSLKISGYYIYEADSPKIYMDNLISLTLDSISHSCLLLDFLQIKNLDGGTFTTISLSGGWGVWLTAVNSVGFSFTAAVSPDENPQEDEFIRRYFSRATLVRLEDFQIIFHVERLLSILRILGDSGGDMGRLELHVETEYLDTDTQIAIYAKPFLPRLGTLVVYLAEWAEPWGWVEVMVEDLFDPDHDARFPDECIFEVYYFDSGLFLSTNMGELRAGFEGGGSYNSLISRSQQSPPT